MYAQNRVWSFDEGTIRYAGLLVGELCVRVRVCVRVCLADSEYSGIESDRERERE